VKILILVMAVLILMGLAIANIEGKLFPPKGAMYRISWQSKITGAKGSGNAFLTKEQAKSAAAYLNAGWPEIDHRVTF
jgi:hypothetical protein